MFVGTRPEVIKMMPIERLLRQKSEHFELIVCSTGQHRELFHQVSESLEFQVDINLDLMLPKQRLSELHARIISGADKTILDISPDLVLVHGDTTTALASAISSFYNRVPVAHVESGLRTHNFDSPFPEEFNRQSISRLSRYNFAPTSKNRMNLLKEGIDEDKIFVTGNTVVDALRLVCGVLDTNEYLSGKLQIRLRELVGFDWISEQFLLVTGHRRENFGLGFEEICFALKDIAKRNPRLHIIYPVHLNPNVRQPVSAILSKIENIHLIEPLDYLEFVYLMRQCAFILTDSGGIQEEAPTLGKRVLLMRENSERGEALALGQSKLVGPNRAEIVIETERMLGENPTNRTIPVVKNPYGDGFAAQRIVSTLIGKL